MSFADIRQGIYNWVRTESNLTVIWADQSEVRPPRPYVALKLISGPRRRGHDDLRQNGLGVFEVHGQRQWTCSVNVIGSGAMDTIMLLQDSLEKPSVQDSLRVKKLAFVKAEVAQDATLELDTGYESRAQMDVFFTSTALLEDTNTTNIENVELENEIDGKIIII